MQLRNIRTYAPRPAGFRVIAMSLFALLIAACEWYGPKTRDWEEDVLLDDGSTIRIKRHVEFVDNNSLSGDAYSATETSATLELPERFSVPVWQAPFRPMVLYRDGGQWVIVSSSTSCEIWRKNGRPRPPYWEHRPINGTWKQIPLSDSSIGRVPNLLFEYDKRPPVLVSVKAKQAQLQGFGLLDDFTMIRKDARDFRCN